ncbi:MAG: DUF1574 domain-containing protein [Nodosilinea sp.]
MGVPAAALHTKLRGNILHVLCETAAPLDQSAVLLKLVRALLDSDDDSRLQQNYPQVYQLYLYSRLTGDATPDWTAPIYLNRLERHLAQLVLENQDEADVKAAQSLLERYTETHPDLRRQGHSGSGAIVLSNLSLARKGDPEAIAWYLSETLSALDVGVWVSIKAIPGTAHLHRLATAAGEVTTEELEARAPSPAPLAATVDDTTIPRLWILCEAAYSPDPSLIARPTAERLRQLQLTQFRDAVLVLQVRGEGQPDWSLRIDLTPPEEMLREWARWGDADAIQRLLTAALAEQYVEVETQLANATLHLTCCSPIGNLHLDAPVDRDADSGADGSHANGNGAGEGESNDGSGPSQLVEAIAAILEDLAPQGLHRAVIYGQPRHQSAPAWVHYLDLPAAQHRDLADPPEYLGQTGDLPAIAFLLTRQLNPNLDDRLATGGLRVQLLVRDQLLHIMVDSPLLPHRRLVVPVVKEYLLALSPVGVEGIRIYGRRSGQAQPAWSYGQDFLTRSRLVPESTPEFTASDAYVNELLVRPDQPVTQADLAVPTDPPTLGAWGQDLLARWQGWLVRSHLFASPDSDSQLELGTDPAQAEGIKIAMVWGAVGLLVALQLDWVLGQVLSPPTNAASAEPIATPATPAPSSSFEESLSNLQWPNPGSGVAVGEEAFVGAEADPAAPDSDLATSPSQPIVALDDLVANSPFPTFNSQQLDEKVALYYQHLEESGPPDVLIIGSSRALRGVDPVALRKELAAMGYDDISIFNFGINGATAQVVDLVIRQLLKPDQLPQLILWADGARAFNSGRVDVTYNAIAASPGYQELMAQRARDAESDPAVAAAEGTADPALESFETSLPDSYGAMDQRLSEQIGRLSAVYGDRARLKSWVQNRIAAATVPLPQGGDSLEEPLDAPTPEASTIDFDGFWALSVRFNPATYYQDYARVLGHYDRDYDSFRLDGDQSEAFSTLLSYTQAQNIPVVFINTPLTDEYLDDYRQEAETEFLQHMLKLSTTEAGFVFRDFGLLWPTRYDYFSDPSHLNRYGAYQVSLELSQDPLISWPRSTSPSTP